MNLLPIQTKVVEHLLNNRNTIFLHSRNIGIIKAYTRHVLDYVEGNADRTVYICSPSSPFTLGRELFDNIAKYIEPDLVREQTSRKIKLYNGCIIKYSKIHKNANFWGHIDKFILLEAALVPNAVIQQLFREVFTILSARKDTSISIASTPNGKNHFHELFTNAEKPDNDPDKNSYAAMRVYYWMVEGRDGHWVKEQVANIGSEEAFNQEYNLVFYTKKEKKKYGI